MPITTTSNLPPMVQQWADRSMLSVKQPNIIHGTAALRKQIPMNEGQVIRFRRDDKLIPPTVPLGNTGVTPPSQVITAVDIDAKLEVHGTFIEMNQQVKEFVACLKSSLIDLEALA